MQSLLKSMTTFGPIVILPDNEDAVFDYQPDLHGWLTPETATDYLVLADAPLTHLFTRVLRK